MKRRLKKIGMIALEILLFPFKCVYYILKFIGKAILHIIEAIFEFLGALFD